MVHTSDALLRYDSPEALTAHLPTRSTGDMQDYLKAIGAAIKAGNATEHTHRPALKRLVESLKKNVIATNEPKRVACGAPDFVVSRGSSPLGYIETKDVDDDLDKTEASEQLKRYRESLGNLILTDYLEFRWFVCGERRLVVRLAEVKRNTLDIELGGPEQLKNLLTTFLETEAPTVSSPQELATRMAGIARLMRDIIVATLDAERSSGTLHEQMKSFQRVLLPDLTAAQFADMYAQTICYGLFAARMNHTKRTPFNREGAAYDLPRTNPFLREVFGHIAGPELDERLAWAVEDLVELLRHADIDEILKDFGKHTHGEDRVIPFYETFLAAYDPALREARGVYYTPQAVVNFIVHSIHHLLRDDFKLEKGLADSSVITTRTGDGETRDVHRVLILDPAVGTGTFLWEVIEQILVHIRNPGARASYIRDHLLPRMFGFELLMAPYAVAHMKLGLKLQEHGYDFGSDERLRVYLTNTLEQAHAESGLPLFARAIAEEASAAAHVKETAPVMVVLGNPPYSGHSQNRGGWITDLIESYKAGCPELRKPGQAKWLSDDYVKFFRFAQWRIEQTGYGILAFISNHGYLDNPTFRGMRRSLMSTFDDIYILDLHGNAKKGEHAPNGGADDNVFDIQQGVAIGLFVKRISRKTNKGQLATVRHAELWGPREQLDKSGDLVGGKYHWLWNNDVSTTKWKSLSPEDPAYLFVPRSTKGHKDYESGWSVRDIFSPNGDPAPGIVTTHDQFAISWTRDEAIDKVERLLDTSTEAEARSLFRLCRQNQWQYKRAKKELADPSWRHEAIQLLYRPFDFRWTIFNRNVAVHRRERVMRHMLPGDNLGLLTSRLTKGETFKHVQVTRRVTEVICMSPKTSNNGFLFPLYLHESGESEPMLSLFEDKKKRKTRREPNLNPDLVRELAEKYDMTFVTESSGDLSKTFGPEDVFGYIVAVLHSSEYRDRYAEFLKADFPRIPFTSDRKLFRALSRLGTELTTVQLMETALPEVATFPISGSGLVDEVRYEADGKKGGRVWINEHQHFKGLPSAIWDLEIGGYQVCDKWLKNRRGRKLTFDDVEHYGKITSVLSETLRIAPLIDAAVRDHGGWPVQ